MIAKAQDMRSQKNESGRDCIDTWEGSKTEVSTVLITTKTLEGQ
jgi:hypothetical protein